MSATARILSSAFLAAIVVVAIALHALGSSFSGSGGGAGGSSLQAVCIVQNSTSQSLTQNSNTTLSWDTINEQNGSIFSTGSPTKFTAPAAGYYYMTGTIVTTATGSGVCLLFLEKNGVVAIFQQLGAFNLENVSSGAQGFCCPISTTFYLNQNDYVTMCAFTASSGISVLANTGGAYSYLSVSYLGAGSNAASALSGTLSWITAFTPSETSPNVEGNLNGFFLAPLGTVETPWLAFPPNNKTKTFAHGGTTSANLISVSVNGASWTGTLHWNLSGQDTHATTENNYGCCGQTHIYVGDVTGGGQFSNSVQTDTAASGGTRSSSVTPTFSATESGTTATISVSIAWANTTDPSGATLQYWLDGGTYTATTALTWD